MARPRARKVQYSSGPWSHTGYHSPGIARKTSATLPQLQQLRSGLRMGRGWPFVERSLRLKLGFNNWRIHASHAPYVVGPSYAPLTGHFPGGSSSYECEHALYFPQKPSARRRRANRRRSKRGAGFKRSRRSSVLVCPPAPHLSNSFYMQRAEEQRAQAAARQQAELEVTARFPAASLLDCPPAPYLSNEHFMHKEEQRVAEERAAGERKAAQQQGLAAQIKLRQSHACLLMPSMYDRHMLEITSEQQLSASSHTAAVSDSVSVVSSTQHLLDIAAEVAERGIVFDKAEEEVCMWDPETQVAVESF